MTIEEKYQKLLEFVNKLYRLKNDWMVSMHEASCNEITSKKAEKILKEIGEFK